MSYAGIGYKFSIKVPNVFYNNIYLEEESGYHMCKNGIDKYISMVKLTKNNKTRKQSTPRI